MKGDRHVSPLTLHRLSIYLRCLRSLSGEGVTTVSSQTMAESFELSASQIRKDLAQFGEFGIRGVGYDVDQLSTRLQSLLGLDRHHPTVVVGTGNLGSALIRFLNAQKAAFSVVGAVDNDQDKIGVSIAGVLVRPAEDLAEIVAETSAEVGVLTVPSQAAQANYDALVAAGIRAVMNFAPIRLRRAGQIPTRSVDLRIFFEELGFLLA